MRFRSWRSETWKRFFRRSSPHLISRCLLVPNCLRADLPNDVQQIRMTEIGHGLSTGGHFVQKCQVTSSKSKKKTTFRYKKYHAFPLIPKQRYLGHSCPIRDPPYLWVSLYGRNILHIPPRCSALNDPLVDHASITCERFLYLFLRIRRDLRTRWTLDCRLSLLGIVVPDGRFFRNFFVFLKKSYSKTTLL